ncbi:MAG TPA: serine protease [Burkholderiales bacterium]|nr:serine protease [Burkholderiales bacterium]
MDFSPSRRPGFWALCSSFALMFTFPASCLAQSEYARAIEKVKPSIVAVGTFERLRNPEFRFLGTGFAVGDGSLIATNNHVVPGALDSARFETVAIALPGPGRTVQVRAAREVAADPSHDLALLRIDGPPLPALRVGDSERVREGDICLFTGFPIGPVLGLFPVTNRAMISAITPIVIPASNANQLNGRAIRRIAAGAYPVFQLDGTAYPGNSGSPLYDPRSAEVIGIVNMVFVKGTKESALTEPSGISYAIPARKLSELLTRTH